MTDVIPFAYNVDIAVLKDDLSIDHWTKDSQHAYDLNCWSSDNTECAWILMAH